MIPLLILFVIAILLIYYLASSPFNYWKKRNVPHPPISYLFGNIKEAIFLRKAISEVYNELYKRYNDVLYLGIYRSRTPCILLRDPDMIKDVLVKNFSNFSDNDIVIDERNDPLFAKNPFVSSKTSWRQNRGQVAPSFTAKRVKEMVPLIKNVAENLVKYIHKYVVDHGKGVSAKELFIKYTTDVVISCALGLDANSFVDPNSQNVKMINTIVSPSLSVKTRLFIMFNFPALSKLLKLRFIPHKAENYYKTIIKKTLEYRKEHNIYRGDFLDGALEKMKSGAISESDIAGHVVTFIVEGTETSAITLTFTLYELALHPDIQANLRREVDEVFEKHQGDITFEVIEEMAYLDQVISENLRKNTPAPLIRRLCTEDTSVRSPNGTSSDITIENGTPVIIPVYSIHHDPKYYPQPDIYNPSRFTSENKNKRPNYTFLPFGEGPRICIGARFGNAQIKIAIVHLLHHFEIGINKQTVVPYVTDPHYFLLEAKDGIFLDFHRRK